MTERVYDARPEVVFSVLKQVCNHSPFRIERVDESVLRLRVRTGWSLLSWGESLDVLVRPDSRGTLVHIEGRPTAFFNISAGVEGRVAELFRRLETAL